MSSKTSRVIHNYTKNFFLSPPLDSQMSSDLIKNKLKDNKPLMIARFGSVEIKGVIYAMLPLLLKKIFRKRVFSTMNLNAGFFPVNDLSLMKFSELMRRDMKEVDILGSWRIEEIFFSRSINNSKRVKLDSLEPYLQSNPWSEALRDKKILVVHPFNKTIEEQYKVNRINLFKNKHVLPHFKSLATIKAVQTIAGSKSEFKDWFEALNHMKKEISKTNFDVAILGCGAYGFPLAAHIKRMGKMAVHMGGATQMLFGIKGKRWEENSKFDEIINDFFIYPSNEDKPKNANKVEGGCYW